ncbi:hypothetical protein MRX96_057361 [Rhipicephalus microplus]
MIRNLVVSGTKNSLGSETIVQEKGLTSQKAEQVLRIDVEAKDENRNSAAEEEDSMPAVTTEKDTDEYLEGAVDVKEVGDEETPEDEEGCG